jgi:hypothetical protein
VSVVYCQVAVAATGWSLLQRMLSSVLCLSVISKTEQGGDLDPLELSSRERRNFSTAQEAAY